MHGVHLRDGNPDIWGESGSPSYSVRGLRLKAALWLPAQHTSSLTSSGSTRHQPCNSGQDPLPPCLGFLTCKTGKIIALHTGIVWGVNKRTWVKQIDLPSWFRTREIPWVLSLCRFPHSRFWAALRPDQGIPGETKVVKSVQGYVKCWPLPQFAC